jgi:ABC-type Na+ transport system ATPase subunit NatA
MELQYDDMTAEDQIKYVERLNDRKEQAKSDPSNQYR